MARQQTPASYRQQRRGPTKRVQVRRLLESRIGTELGAGDPIPSERALVDELGVSRVTVRQAIADLVTAGRLERIHGKGTFVTGPQVESRLHLTSFSREMRSRGLVPETRLITGVRETADAELAEQLQRPPGEPVYRLERLRLADGSPMAFEVGHYPTRLFPDLLGHQLDALYDVFAQRYGVHVTSGVQTVSADSADLRLARVLDAYRRAPLLVQQRITKAGDDVIEVSTSWYRADRYRIHMAITPDPG